MGVEGFGGGLAWVVTGQFSLILLTNQLVIERSFEYNGGMELGDPRAPLWMRPSTPSMKLSIT